MDHQGAFDYGFDAALDYLRDGKPDQIRGILADAHGKDAQRKAAASLACRGFFHTIAQTLDLARTKGIRFKGAVPTMAEFRYESSCGQAAYSRVAQRLIDAAFAFRRDAPCFVVSRAKAGAGDGDKPAPAPAAPVKVEIVGMPVRETASKVKRNEAGEITSTTQIEMDAT